MKVGCLSGHLVLVCCVTNCLFLVCKFVIVPWQVLSCTLFLWRFAMICSAGLLTVHGCCSQLLLSLLPSIFRGVCGV